MQNTSSITNFDRIISTGVYTVETKLNINGVDYFENDLIRVEVSSSLFWDEPSTGKCQSAEIFIEMAYPQVTIPPMAVIKPYIRLVSEDSFQYEVSGTILDIENGSVDDDTAELTDNISVSGTTAVINNYPVTTYSGWLQKGEFFIDTRERTDYDITPPVLTIHGYDAMLKTEAFYPEDDPANYPMLDTDVVDLIAETIEVPVDDRTYEIMIDGYEINLPATYTMREVLGNIASMYAGNFCITPEGKLRLVALTGIGTETNYLIDQQGDAITFGGDRILV